MRRMIHARSLPHMAPGESCSGTKNIVHGHLSGIMQALEHSPAISYIVDSDYRVMYCNPAWNRFAEANGAPHLTSHAVVGSDLFDAIPEVLTGFYSHAFRQVRSTGHVWEQYLQCSSPASFRMYRMRIHLLKPMDWFAVTNTLVVEQSHARTAIADAARYLDHDGSINMCAHCRCTRRAISHDQWDFVPEYLRLSADSVISVRNGLCPVCRAYFYRFE